ncbi:MAG: sialidase family protein [Thermoplasmatota archaeon]
MRILLAFCLLAASTAGCLGSDDDDSGPTVATTEALPGFTGLPLPDLPVLGVPQLIDTVRAGGEPVIAILPSGTILVSAHPGWTHYHPSEDPTHVGAEILTPANAQSYLWRSTDNGTTWQHVNLAGLPVNNAPRNAALGVSDPEFTVMEDGTVCTTDLLALATSSVACSSDDGLTWLPGNPVAAGGPNDRQWLASKGDELYFTANYFVDHHIRASTDGGLTWERRGDVPCSQDLVTNPLTGNIVVACENGVAVSEDDGFTWSDIRMVPNSTAGGQRILTEPGIDAAGNTWIAWTSGERSLFAAGSPDEGVSWPWVFDLTAHFTFDNLVQTGNETTGTYVWPWLSAGSEGRLAVSWIGTRDAVDSATHAGEWHLYTAYLLDAVEPTPIVHVQQVTTDPLHVGPICQSGTVCQVASLQGDDAGDRRLGDFFETTIDAEGFLHLTWADTYSAAQDVIAHPAYSRQTGGVRLLADEDIGVWMPTQG